MIIKNLINRFLSENHSDYCRMKNRLENTDAGRFLDKAIDESFTKALFQISTKIPVRFQTRVKKILRDFYGETRQAVSNFLNEKE